MEHRADLGRGTTFKLILLRAIRDSSIVSNRICRKYADSPLYIFFRDVKPSLCPGRQYNKQNRARPRNEYTLKLSTCFELDISTKSEQYEANLFILSL